MALHHRILRLSWILFALLVISAAVVVAAGRMASPWLEAQRPRLTALLAEAAGRPVNVEALRISWRGLTPRVRLEGVTLHDRHARPWLHAESVELAISLPASLRSRTPEITSLAIHGIHLPLVRLASGRITLRGLEEQPPDPELLRHLLGWLQDRRHVVIREAEITLDDRTGRIPPQRLSEVSLQLQRHGRGSRLWGRFRLAGVADPCRLVGELPSGLRGDPATLPWRLHFSGPLPLSPVLAGSGLSLTVEGDGPDGVLWAEGEGAHLQTLQGRLDGRRLEVAGVRDERPWRLRLPTPLDVAFHWRREAEGWALDLRRPFSTSSGAPLDLSVRSRSTAEGNLYRIATTHLRLEEWLPVLLPLLPEEEQRTLGEARPRGILQRLVAEVSIPAAEGPLNYRLQGTAKHLSIRHQGNWPGVRNVSARFDFDPQGGRARVAGRQALLDMPKLFPTPLVLTEMEGDLRWERRDGSLRLEAREVTLHNADLSATARMTLELHPGLPPFLDLQTHFLEGRVASAWRYLPRGIMPETVLGWLDRALVDGTITEGAFLYFGPARKGALREGKAVLEALFDTEGLILDYAPQWPRLEEGVARVQFRQHGMAVQAVAGRIFDVAVEKADIVITQLGRRATLKVRGDLQGPLDSMLRYLRAIPPTAPWREPVLDRLEVSGKAGLTLDLTIPLYRGGPRARVAGTVTPQGARLLLPRDEVRITDLRGEIAFLQDGRGLAFPEERLKGNLQGEPAIFTLSTRETPEGLLTRISAETHNSLQALAGRPLPLFEGVLEGRSRWEVELAVATGGQKRTPLLRLTTDLIGTRVSLPDLLHKPAVSPRPLMVILPLEGEPAAQEIRFRYGERAQGILFLAADTGKAGGVPLWGHIHFGPGEARRREERNLYIDGRLDRFTLSEWLALRDQIGRRTAGVWSPDSLGGAHLEVAQLLLLGHLLHEARFRFYPREDGEGWNIELSGEELEEGVVHIPRTPSEEHPVSFTFRRIELTEPITAEGERPTTDPRHIPPLHVEGEHFLFEGVDLGHLLVEARPVANGLQITRGLLRSPLLAIEADGSWLMDEGHAVSRFRIRVTSDDVGRLAAAMNYRDVIREGRLQMSIDAWWPGPPGGFAWSRLHGKARITIRDGQLLEVKPGGGRIFGLLSFHALPRRLALDFADIFGKGFHFDKIHGSFLVSDGDAFTNDLRLESTAAVVEISGRTGLATRDYDQRVVVTARLSSAIPLVGGLAGGPSVAVGLWLAEKVIGPSINKATQVEYTITGPWDAPVVERLDPTPAPDQEFWNDEEPLYPQGGGTQTPSR